MEKDSKTTPPKPEDKQPETEKPLEGTKEKSPLETAAETIAGDNKLLSAFLKLILSPLGLLAFVGVILYLLYKNKEHKDTIAKLEAELKESKQSAKNRTDKAEESGTKKIRRKNEDQEEDEEHFFQGIPHIPAKNQQRIKGLSKNKTIYID